MENKVKELYNSLSDDELMFLIQELKESDKTGIIGERIRNLAKRSGEITGGFTTTDFFMTQINVLKEASFRWCPKPSTTESV